ncbi:MAG TPA: LuxR C-terminal-related transcriptional regulator [Streptosporangiaceae bacterium]|nr:LuxR C-terminal-related transcriptional regulator [Streptosporangiaceae bacterium]
MTAMISDSVSGARGKVTKRARSVGERNSGHLREVFAGSHSAQDELQATAAALTPMLDGSVPWVHRVWVAAAFLLGAISRDVLDDPAAVRPALERALDLAEADQLLLPLLTPRTSGLPEHQAQHPAAPGASISQVVDLLAQASGPMAPPAERALPCETLTRCEARVLRYLPTNLSTREIANELYLSANTVKTHQRHLYQKLGASSRSEAVERARDLGLLPPSSRRP